MKTKIIEPVGITPEMQDYKLAFINALNWYHANVEKKDGRTYLREYILTSQGKTEAKQFDQVPDSKLPATWCWIARLLTNGNKLNSQHAAEFEQFLSRVREEIPERKEVVKEEVARPNVRDHTEAKAKEYLGDLEHALDLFMFEDKDFDLVVDMKTRNVPAPYLPFIENWLKEKAAEYIFVYESTDEDIKEGYSNINKRKLTQLIKLINEWMEGIESYGQYKKANRKPRVRKAKPPGVQVAKLKYKKEDTDLKIKSVHPTEMVGASQVWVYNTKNRKLAVYRTESASGIQVKGTTLQNYDPDQCEQKTLRKPEEILKTLLAAGKIQLRRLISELKTKETPVNGRINDECLIVRVIR